jgi:outer membrane murein-binding lipoprotein Lpp
VKSLRAVVGAAVVGAVLLVSGCTPSTEVDVVAVNATDVEGQVVKVPLDQVVYINTSDLDADLESYTAVIADPSVVEFVPGRDGGDFGVYPGFTPLGVGSTDVTLTGAGIPPIAFTIEVTDD